MPLAVADHQEAGVIRHLPPFVEIERDRVRAFDSGEPRRECRRENSERTEGAVDVKPQPLYTAQRTQRREIIEGTNVHRPRRADDKEGMQTGLAIPSDPAAQRRD